jgi:hypothetical protein
MRIYESISLAIKELNVNYSHSRIKQIEIIVYKIFFSPKAENNWPDRDWNFR